MTDRKVGPKARALMHHFEDLRLAAYPDPGSGGAPWTIGRGMTYYPDGKAVKRGDRITLATADLMFDQILDRDFAAPVATLIGVVPTTPAQFGAMVSLAYNIGMGPRVWLPGMKKGFRQSEVLKMHRAGRFAAAALAFGSWTRSVGRVMPGLVRRRAAEAAFYLEDYSEVSRLTMGDVA